MAQNGLISPLAILDTINCYMSYLPCLKWNKLILTFNLETMLFSDAWREEFQQCIIRKHNGHTLRWRYDYSHTPRHLVTASLCVRDLGFFWDALYTRNRDSERSMINATTRERRFKRRLQRRFDYGYWNVFLLLGKVINAPSVYFIVHTYNKQTQNLNLRIRRSICRSSILLTL